jgi:hypothetical protein
MFIVLVGGYVNQRERFFDEMDKNDERVVWINDKRSFYYIADIFVNFGGIVEIPRGKKVVTWSGDTQETLEKIYETLGL